MPKLLPHIQEELLLRARALLKEEGYAALSIRRLAHECGVALGTPYNYFRNKDELVACIMMEDWHKVRARMDFAAANAANLEDGVAIMFQAIRTFVGLYQEVWAQFIQAGGSTGVVNERHKKLRGQIEQALITLARRCDAETVIRIAPLLAETVLAAAVQTDLPEEMLRSLVEPLCNETIQKKGGITP